MNLQIQNPQLQKALTILSKGGVVGIPTESVYGLAADATSDKGVTYLYAIKNRPTTKPLSLLVANTVAAKLWGIFSPQAETLAHAFWQPGTPQHRPLTLVVPLPPNSPISQLATAGGPTVGLRVPDHPMTTALLQAYPNPLAAPSANLSAAPSATTADGVRQSLGDKVPLILEGGPCQVGIASTILDTTQEKIKVLRLGGTNLDEIASILGYVPRG